MSWSEVKKINSDLSLPLDALINAAVGGYKFFTEDGTFTVPKGVTQVYISAVGGGAGGGGSGSASSNTSSSYAVGGSGGGGGAGGYIKDQKYSVLPQSKIDITIGTNGAGGGAGSAGTSGGSTIIGDLVTVVGGTGGGGGGYSSYASSNNHTAGSKGSGGTYNGSDGEYGAASTSNPGSKTGGSGGQQPIFYSKYGYGGKGADAPVARGYNNAQGQPGKSGMSGAVLICWGTYRHELIFPS